jgi:peptidoglycan/xylan/chitin deacetylase (PgdA/CDA1 family)
MGRAAPPPKFKIGGAGLLVPTEYPLWQRASDWIAGRRYVVLTFDDGPYGHGVDEQILAVLEKNHARAIFFEVCAHINKETVNIPGSIVASGNILGNHSFSHLHLPLLRGGALNHQIIGCSDSLEAVSGQRPKFFRPPWGQTSRAVLETARSAGMQQVLWNANSGDTWLDDSKQIINLSLEEVALNRASILLMHSRPATASALDTLLYDLRRRGVRFVIPVYGTNSTH